MKLIFFLLGCLALGGPAAAQPHFRFGGHAGLSIDRFAGSGGDFDDLRTEVKPVRGWHGGLSVEWQPRRFFFLSTALEAEKNGYRYEIRQGPIGYELWREAIYLKLPVVAAFAARNVYAGAGFYAGYGLGGTFRSTWYGKEFVTVDLPPDQNRGILWGDAPENDFRRFDAGGILEAGVRIGWLRLAAAWHFGLIDATPADYGDVLSGYHRVLRLRAGCLIPWRGRKNAAATDAAPQPGS